MKVYRSNRVEALADALVEVLRRPVADPMAPEIVVVHSQAMERWLAMRLAEQLGVCAHVAFPFPEGVVLRTFAAVLGEDERALQAWTPRRLHWSVLAALPALLHEPAFEPLRDWLGARDDGALGDRHVHLAKRIARIFDRYVTFRPDVVRRWDKRKETADEAGWQPQLWRAVRAGIAAPHIADLADRFGANLQRAQLSLPGFGPRLEGLPARLSLFAMSTLPPFYMEVFAAIAKHVELHLFALSPSAEYWADTRSPKEMARKRRSAGEVQAPPLLAAFGRVARDFQEVVLERAGDAEEVECFRDPEGPSLLRRLQSDVLHLRQPATPAIIAADDDSLALHACHGPMRQVEVLRDALLGLFVRHPDLEPRDVVVMTPDIEAYAPLIDAVFADGARPGHDDDPGFPAIPYRIADRTMRRTSPVAEAFLRVLGLAGSRLKASEVLELLAMEPVRERFRIEVDDLPTLETWVAESGIRWGLDAAHRETKGQPPDPENTWRHGLDRLLLGPAMRGEGHHLFGGALPYDEIEGTVTELLGRFVDFCERLFGYVRRLPEPRTPAAWRELLLDLVSDLLRQTPPGSQRMAPTSDETQPLRDAVVEMVEGAEAAGLQATPLALEAVQALLTDALDAPSRAQGFFTGGITFSAMVPMRSIPFRVVCLLGMDDGAFPRSTPRTAFDLMAQKPRVGDRNPRDDDRYLFLEALLAARDHLLVTWTGRDIRTNEALPPAVPVGELLDAVEAGFALESGASLRRHLTVEHPLQPFSPRCFGASPAPPGYDRRFLSAARRLRGEREPAPPFVPGALPAATEPATPAAWQIPLDDLVKFVQGPVRWLLRDRLGLALESTDVVRADREPIQLDGLERYEIGTDLLSLGLRGMGADAVLEPVRASGRLPPGVPGRLVFDDLARQAGPLAERVRALDGPPLEPVVLDLPVAGARLVGRVGGLREGGALSWQYGRVRARQQLAMWVRHLALHAAGAFTGPSRLVARGEEGLPELVTLAPPSEALETLERLVDLYRQGQAAPLPFFPETSLAYVQALQAGDPPEKARRAAERAWRHTNPAAPPGEGDDAYVVRAFGDPAPLPPGDDFHFAALAIWAPVLKVLTFED